MELISFKKEMHAQLTESYPKNEIDSFFYRLLDHHLGMSKMDCALHPNRRLSISQLNELMSALTQLQKHIPLQYIIGQTSFQGSFLHVTPSVLIPRPETEELVAWAIDSAQPPSVQRILDIGTGSGCIAISLAKAFPEADTTAIDISKSALKLAKQNAVQNQVIVDFQCVNILENQSVADSYDLIISNPPYVTFSEKKQMNANVLDHEPHRALFVPDSNPLLFYNAIGSFASQHLSDNGLLFFEINEQYGKSVVTLLKDLKFHDIELRKDFRGKDRMIRAKK